ncbi:hypothetical protein [Ahrensia sp. R2A130]|uniref:DUF6948 domain-containing protein n=1 Tax=Ahrensia sp. R2A130 TaxID=744979 RepID=UPI0001E0BCBE|nr:hypothetical protein [Ahrensia sp. R2A130]EFL88326.1 putative glyceraldehyde-3-phosphate dehydrogenase [Ahrensia sp. R2A130]
MSKTPVIVCTAHRGVVFGDTKNPKKNPIKLKNARMCLYWPSEIGGVFGLGDVGPNADTKISATLSKIELRDVTAVFAVSSEAVKAWKKAPVQGRS